MANNNQKAQIHILKDQLGMSEDEYRSMLAGYGVSSSADEDFSAQKADDMIGKLRRMTSPTPPAGGAPPSKGDGNVHGWGRNKYEYLRPRPGNMGDPKQLRKIEAMWRDLARNPSDEALANFLENHVGIRNIVWLEKPHVEAVLCAEGAMASYTNAKSNKVSTDDG